MRYRICLKPAGRQAASAGWLVTLVTAAPSGPVQKRSSILSIRVVRAGDRAVTEPSASFLTQPRRPSASA